MSIEDIIGVILGISGIVTGYIFYRKGLRVREPTISIKTNNLIQDHVSQIDGLEILYKGQLVRNLSVSKIIFWNNGSETIDKEDIVQANPLRIVGKDGVSILDAKIVAENNKASLFTCYLDDEGKLRITFDYLDKDHGAVIQLTHTGLSSKDLVVEGQIKGVKVIKWTELDFVDVVAMYRSNRIKPSVRKALSFLFWFFGGSLFSCFGITFLSSIYANGWRIPENVRDSYGNSPPPDLFFYGITVMLIIPGIMMLSFAIGITQKRIPKGLDSFEYD